MAKVETKTNPKEGKSKNKNSLDDKNAKTAVKQIVEQQRNIKYNYPDGMKDQLKRKAHRQKLRNELKRIKLDLAEATKGKDDKKIKKFTLSLKRFAKANYTQPELVV